MFHFHFNLSFKFFMNHYLLKIEFLLNHPHLRLPLNNILYQWLFHVKEYMSDLQYVAHSLKFFDFGPIHKKFVFALNFFLTVLYAMISRSIKLFCFCRISLPTGFLILFKILINGNGGT